MERNEVVEEGSEPVVYTRLDLKRMQDHVRGNLTKAEAIRMQYDGKSADMSGQEETEYVRLVEDANTYKSKIEAAQKYLSLKSWVESANGGLNMGGPGAQPQSSAETLKAQHKAHYREYMRGVKKESQHQLAKFIAEGGVELKAYQSDNPSGGGFAVMPQEMVENFITLLKDMVYMRKAATVHQVPTAESLGVPAIDTDPSDADWTAELATGGQETTLQVGKREFRPHPLAKNLNVSKKLLRQVASVETVILDRLAYKMAISEEKAFLVGDGADKPLGVYTASVNGISTNRDTVAAGANAIVADDVLNTFYSLKASYRARASWLINRSILLAVRKLKDSTNNYLWTAGYGNQTGMVTGPGGGLAGTPDTLMGRPIWESEYAPGTVTSGLYTMLIGDFSQYWIADALDMVLEVLYELYAPANQMGFILRKETDGTPVLEEAFARLRQA